MSTDVVNFPKDFKCPACGTTLHFGTAITKEAQERGLFKGHLILCSECKAFLRVGDSALEKLTVEQFKALPTEMQRLLGIARGELEGKIRKN